MSKCFECGSESHRARDCGAKQRNSGPNAQGEPHNYFGEGGEQNTELTFTREEVFETKVRLFSVESIGHIVLDSWCSRTVCGVPWLKSF